MNILNPDRSFSLELNGEVFRGKFPLPSQDIDIDLAVSRRMGGVPLDSLPTSTYGYLVAIKTLDAVITDKPDSFLRRFKSFEEVDDSEFVVELYSQYLNLKNQFIESGKKNRDSRNSEPEPRVDPRPVPHAEVSHPDESGYPNNSGYVPVSKGVHPGSNVDPRGFHELPRENQGYPENSGSRENEPQRMDTQAPSNYPGGSGRVHRGEDHPRR